MFSRFFIYRPVFALVIAIVIVILGSISIPTLPVESMPDITPPTVEVSTTFPGASAQVVEQTVTTPIEKEVNGVENMIYMQSKSTSVGQLNLTVSFEIGTDPDMAAVLTQNRVSIAEPLLPEEVKRQGVKTEKKSTQITLMVNLISPDGTYDDIFISNYATTQINDVLARVRGVGKVTAMGAKDFGMRIWLDPGKLKARNLTTDEVINALREQGCRIVATSLDPSSIPLDKLPLDQKTALCFGTEEDGLSETILKEADMHVHIPMFGFTQSFNISVSAALCLYDLRKRLPDYMENWQLAGPEKRQAQLLWLRNSVRNFDIQERVFLQEHKSD